MKNWIQKILVLIGAGVVYVVGQYFRGYWWPDLTWPFSCSKVVSGAVTYCDSYIRDPLQLAWPLIAAGEIFAIVGVILLFANVSGLRAWWKLSIWYVPIVALFLAFAAPLPLFPVVAPMSRESLVWIFGVVYIVLSLGAVLRGRFREYHEYHS